MNTKAKKVFLTLFLSAAVLTVSFAQPRQGRGYGPGPGPGFGQESPAQKGMRIENVIPDLTEEQKSELKSLRTEHLKVMRDFRNQMGEIAAKQCTAMSADPINQKETDNLIDQKTELLNKQMKAQVAHRAAIKEVLTEEQVLAMDEFRQRRQFAGNNGRPGHGYRNGYGPHHRL